METFIIKSRKLNKEVNFSISECGYIWTDLFNGKPGTLGDQICEGGKLSGSTVIGGEKEAKKWFNSWIKIVGNVEEYLLANGE